MDISSTGGQPFEPRAVQQLAETANNLGLTLQDAAKIAVIVSSFLEVGGPMLDRLKDEQIFALACNMLTVGIQLGTLGVLDEHSAKSIPDAIKVLRKGFR